MLSSVKLRLMITVGVLSLSVAACTGHTKGSGSPVASTSRSTTAAASTAPASTPPPAPLVAGRAVQVATAASKQQQIQALTKTLSNIKAHIASGGNTWGDLDLRDVFSYRVDQLWA